MWLKESHRIEHLLYAIPSAILFTILFTVGLAIGMEIKDKIYSNNFDWLDVSATLIGGLIGQIIQILIIFIIKYIFF